jgi:hypothetical protein
MPKIFIRLPKNICESSKEPDKTMDNVLLYFGRGGAAGLREGVEAAIT